MNIQSPKSVGGVASAGVRTTVGATSSGYDAPVRHPLALRRVEPVSRVSVRGRADIFDARTTLSRHEALTKSSKEG
jgi:hypothetical protein